MDHWLVLYAFIVLLMSVSGEIIETSGCTGTTLIASCDTENPIKIRKVIFGRSLDAGSTVCKYQPGDCQLELSPVFDQFGIFAAITSTCAAKRYCSVNAVEARLATCQLPDNPVVGALSKYMTLVYECKATDKPTTVAPPVETTTAAPPETTTTAAPEVTTTAPPKVTTTAPPEVTTTAPPEVTTTKVPVVTTTAAPPVVTTEDDNTTNLNTSTVVVPEISTAPTTNYTNFTKPSASPVEEGPREWLLWVIIVSIVGGSIFFIIVLVILLKCTRRNPQNPDGLQPKHKDDIVMTAANGMYGNGGSAGDGYINGYSNAPTTTLTPLPAPAVPPTTERKVDKMTSYHKKMEIDVDALYSHFNEQNMGSQERLIKQVDEPDHAAIGAAMPNSNAIPNSQRASAASPATPILNITPVTMVQNQKLIGVTPHQSRPLTSNDQQTGDSSGGKYSRPVKTKLNEQITSGQPVLTPADGDLYYAYQQMPEQDYCFYGDLYPGTDIYDI